MVAGSVQFDPLGHQGIPTIFDVATHPPDDLIGMAGNDPMQQNHLIEVISNRGRNTISCRVLDYYLEMLCEHARNRLGGRRGLFEAMTSEFWPALRVTGRYEQRALARLSRTLRRHQLSGSRFLECRFLLIPTDINVGGPAGHAALLAISPLHKTVDVLDSWRLGQEERAKIALSRTFRFLAHHLGDRFLPGHWRVRWGFSPFQTNHVDCAIFACTNAMSLLFRWHLNYDQSDIPAKRSRMVVEILRGLGTFNYPFPNPYPNTMWETGFKALPLVPGVWRRLPTAARVRPGKFRKYQVLDLVEHCEKAPGVGREPDAVAWRQWRRLPLAQFRQQVEQREADLWYEEEQDTDDEN